jgi:hypothetical protein
VPRVTGPSADGVLEGVGVEGDVHGVGQFDRGTERLVGLEAVAASSGSLKTVT